MKRHNRARSGFQALAGVRCVSTIWSLLDCWTLGSAAREPRRSKTPPVSVANYWEPEHLYLVEQIFSRRERNRIDRLHEVVVLGWLVRVAHNEGGDIGGPAGHLNGRHHQ